MIPNRPHGLQSSRAVEQRAELIESQMGKEAAAFGFCGLN